jgi:hypothetical protein
MIGKRGVLTEVTDVDVFGQLEPIAKFVIAIFPLALEDSDRTFVARYIDRGDG